MSPPPVLTVVIPIYNERDLWRSCFERIRRAMPDGLEVVLVDDGSTDGTREQLAELAAQGPAGVSVLFHQQNRGKGAALRTGFAAASGNVVIVQDADLEYDPADYAAVIAPIASGRADACYGSRFAAGRPKGMTLTSYLANRFLTAMFNVLHGSRLEDMETCYKAVRRDMLSRVKLKQDRFGFEPEISSKLVRLGARIAQTPVSYRARSRAQGKKIGWRDGIKTIWCILRYRFERA
jgi:glycosyltransferase involved in cell wall biosynthesis